MVQPSIGDHHVVIEQHEVFPACLLQSLIDRGGEASIFSIGNHGDRHGRGILHAARYAAVPSVDPLSMTINSHGGRV